MIAFFLEFLMFSFESPNPSVANIHCEAFLLLIIVFLYSEKNMFLESAYFHHILYLAAICQTSIDFFSLPSNAERLLLHLKSPFLFIHWCSQL